MAKIHLRGGHSIDVSLEKAVEINNDWIMKVLPEIIELSTESFRSSEIKGIEGITKTGTEDGRHFLNDPKTKEQVLEFERKYLQYLKDNPDKNKAFSHLVWFESMGAVKVDTDGINYTITNRELFRELQWKFSSWNQLRWMRERAKESGTPSLEDYEPKEIDVNELDL